MKLYVAAIILFLFVACSDKPQTGNVVDENRKAKNKQTAVKNEVTEITREAQKIEQRGRGMEMFRQAGTPENMRECNASMEEGRKQTSDLEARIKNLPDNYSIQLTPLIADLNECVSCTKTAKTSCVSARASINKAIKEIFPQ